MCRKRRKTSSYLFFGRKEIYCRLNNKVKCRNMEELMDWVEKRCASTIVF